MVLGSLRNFRRRALHGKLGRYVDGLLGEIHHIGIVIPGQHVQGQLQVSAAEEIAQHGPGMVSGKVTRRGHIEFPRAHTPAHRVFDTAHQALVAFA